jgi:hypothetical protein
MIKFGRPSYAGVTATLALILALSGTSYAAVTLGKATVGTAQLKNGAVTTPKLHGSAVTSGKVKNGSIESKDLSSSAKTSAYWSEEDGNRAVGANEGSPLVAASLVLPKGKYLVIGTTGLTNISGGDVSAYCVLHDGTDELTRTRAFDLANQRSTDATVTGVTTLSVDTTVELRCWGSSGVWVPSGGRPSIAAVSVASATTQ